MKESKDLKMGYDSDGNVAFYDKDGKMVGVAEDMCTSQLFEDREKIHKEAVEDLIKMGYSKERAEEIWKGSQDEPFDIDDDEETEDSGKTFSTFKKQ